MAISNINNLTNKTLVKNTINEKSNKENIKTKEDKTEIVDKFEKQDQTLKDATYKKPVNRRDEETISRIKAEADQVHQNLRNLVEKLLRKQGMTFEDLKFDGEDIEIDDETRAQAKQAIDEGGELSIESVSDRLVDFAKAISGGDKSKIKILKEAIEEGFRQAEKAFGGNLPEISHKTLQKTMEKLNSWENE